MPKITAACRGSGPEPGNMRQEPVMPKWVTSNSDSPLGRTQSQRRHFPRRRISWIRTPSTACWNAKTDTGRTNRGLSTSTVSMHWPRTCGSNHRPKASTSGNSGMVKT